MRCAISTTCGSGPSFLQEQEYQGWAKDLKALLRELKAATDRARTGRPIHLPLAERAAFLVRSQALLSARPAARPGQRGRLAQSPARNRLERLALPQEQGLAFLVDLSDDLSDDRSIPFDNNLAEHDRRGLKVQQKVSGCLRSDRGAQAYATIRGDLATLRQQGQALLAALTAVCAGQPLYPASA